MYLKLGHRWEVTQIKITLCVPSYLCPNSEGARHSENHRMNLSLVLEDSPRENNMEWFAINHHTTIL